jgi:hypothetical protein
MTESNQLRIRWLAATYSSVAAAKQLVDHRYFNSKNQAGVFLGYDKTSQSAVEVIKRIEAERDAINSEFEKSQLRLAWTHKPDGKLEVATSTQFPNAQDKQYREKELRWFSVAINAFVNVFRPRVAAAWEELTVG